MFCTLLFNFVNFVNSYCLVIYSYCYVIYYYCYDDIYCYFYVYVFLLSRMFRSGYPVSMCCSVYCLCVNVYSTTATGCQPNCS